MQMSDGLGVNCAACRTSRAFADWSRSTPLQLPAWCAIHRTRAIDRDHVEPLADVPPPVRFGPAGGPAEADGMACHVGELSPWAACPWWSTSPAAWVPPLRAYASRRRPTGARPSRTRPLAERDHRGGPASD